MINEITHCQQKKITDTKNIGIGNHNVNFAHRLAKEADYYVKEVEENTAKLEKMKAENRDFYDIKKFAEVVGESEMMIPDSKKRLQQNLEELCQFVKTNKDDLDVEGEWYVTAKNLLQQYDIDLVSASGVEKEDAVETNVDELKEGEAF